MLQAANSYIIAHAIHFKQQIATYLHMQYTSNSKLLHTCKCNMLQTANCYILAHAIHFKQQIATYLHMQYASNSKLLHTCTCNTLQTASWFASCTCNRLQTANWFASYDNWAVTCDFQLCGILTYVDSASAAPFKLRNSKWCSVSSLTIIEYSINQQRLWSVCAYAQADLRLCWSHIPHCWKSHALAQFSCVWRRATPGSHMQNKPHTCFIGCQKLVYCWLFLCFILQSNITVNRINH